MATASFRTERGVLGQRVISNTQIMWAEPLLAGVSAQKAELVALTMALELRKDKILLLPLKSMDLSIGRKAF